MDRPVFSFNWPHSFNSISKFDTKLNNYNVFLSLNRDIRSQLALLIIESLKSEEFLQFYVETVLYMLEYFMFTHKNASVYKFTESF